MHFTEIFVVLSFVSAVFGVIIPADLADGVYEGSIDVAANAKTAFTRIGNVTYPPQPLQGRDLSARVGGGSARMSLSKRDKVGCTGNWVWEASIQYSDLYNKCSSADHNGQTVMPKRSFRLFARGGIYWYGCNYKHYATGCNPNDVEIAYNSVRYRCGDKSGWDWIGAPDHTFGVDVAGAEVCGNV